MMTINRQYGINDDRRLLYNMTQNQDGRISEMVGQRVKVKAYIIYETENKDGEIIQIMKILTEDDQIVGTGSKAFIRGVTDFLDCMGTDDLDEVEIIQKVSSAGRKYIAFKA